MDTQVDSTRKTSDMRWEIYEFLLAERKRVVGRVYPSWTKLGESTVDGLYEDLAEKFSRPSGEPGAYKSEVAREELLGDGVDKHVQNTLLKAAREQLNRDCLEYSERRFSRHAPEGLDAAVGVAASDDAIDKSMRELDELIESKPKDVQSIVRLRVAGFKPGEMKERLSVRRYNRHKDDADSVLVAWATSIRSRAAAFGTALIAFFRRGDSAVETGAAAAGTGGAVAAGTGGVLGGKAVVTCVIVCVGVGGGAAIKHGRSDAEKPKPKPAQASAPAPESRGAVPENGRQADELRRKQAEARRKAEARARARRRAEARAADDEFALRPENAEPATPAPASSKSSSDNEAHWGTEFAP